jgi:hypothetical protein
MVTTMIMSAVRSEIEEGTEYGSGRLELASMRCAYVAAWIDF